MKSASVFRFLSGLCLICCAGCSGESDYKNPGSNVILISIDTLRADHLGCYGHEKNTSPNIDLFAADSVLFETCIAQASSTLPSHASIFTSLIVDHHGALGPTFLLSEDNLTLAEILKDEGYQTVSFNGGGKVSADYGLDQGFDHYETTFGDRFYSQAKKAWDWLRDHSSEKFFMFLHSYEPHLAYKPEKRFAELFLDGYEGALPNTITREIAQDVNAGKLQLSVQDGAHIRNMYDADIRSMDYAFYLLLMAIGELELYEDTLIIFTSDHGEEFGEHGKQATHGNSLYDELLQVPLLIKLPRSKLKGRRVEKLVRSIDIVPTILDVLDIEAPPALEGVSLIGFVTSAEDQDLIAVSAKANSDERSIRTDRWKLYDGRLFDLTNDPLEQHDLSGFHPQPASQLFNKMNEIIEKRKAFTPHAAVLSEETLEQLRQLGYLD
ncbi:MAG: sulfatase-like hydrolase/transferase [Planctomycetes bacterium]|nr:sulfatase-like hydrolase/transferase [Planctomycetota bacterium]